VDTTFARICADRRHHGVVRVERVEEPARQFGHWAIRHVAAPHPADRMVAQYLDDLALAPDATRARQAVALLQRLAEAPVAVPA
jgi:hypothetical protein